MARPKNPQRTTDLLTAVTEAVQRTGIAGMTLRPLATELGVAPRTLLYHFGNKDDLLVAVIRNLRHRQPQISHLLSKDGDTGLDPARRLTSAVQQLWDEAKQPGSRPFLALYFELTSLAIRDPKQYRPLLIEADREWVESITNYLTRSGTAAEDARSITDALLIGYRGALCFALSTGQWTAADTAINTLIGDTRARLSTAGGESPDHTT